MAMESLEKYLETVTGYIFDNDKLVTYKWLSKELEVHVNTAKQILWEFWQKYKKEKDFECTFLLMGILHDDGTHVEIVKEKNLQIAKEKYTKVLSEHIYSIQKALPELQLLGTTENGDIRYSAIKFIENNVRSDKEMHMLRWGAISDEIQLIPQEKVQLVSRPDKTEEVVSPEKKEINKKKNADQKGFNNLFGKAINKQKNPPVSSSNEKMEVDSSNQISKQISKNVVPESSKKTTQKGGLNSFLQQNKDQVKTTDLSEKDNNKNSLKKESIKNVVTTENGSKQKKNVRGKKRNRSKETTNIARKRKRITIQSDSSDSEPSDEEPEEEIPPSPENILPVKEHSISPPKHKIENGKRKILKKVDKTFEEDGFLVTKKVHIYESCSEDDQDVEIKKPKAFESHSELQGKKNTKQTSLTNFFKKL